MDLYKYFIDTDGSISRTTYEIVKDNSWVYWIVDNDGNIDIITKNNVEKLTTDNQLYSLSKDKIEEYRQSMVNKYQKEIDRCTRNVNKYKTLQYEIELAKVKEN